MKRKSIPLMQTTKELSDAGATGIVSARGPSVPLPGSQQQVVQARRIAWSTKSASNGYIYQWSRWHLTHTLTRGEKTLCGKTPPFAKWITPQPGDERGDYRIKGGECQECKRLNEKNQP